MHYIFKRCNYLLFQQFELKTFVLIYDVFTGIYLVECFRILHSR